MKISSNYKMILAVAVILFVLETAYGIYQAMILQTLPADSISRVANAYYVIAVKPPRLSSMGLIWNPLPSLLELPLVSVSFLWKPLVSRGIASCVITAMFSSLSAAVLLRTFFWFQVSGVYAMLFTLIYAFHPYIFYYGSNGMSESMFIFFIIYCICNLTLWFRFAKGNYIVRMAFGLAGGFLVRYEAIPFAIGLGLCVILNILFNSKEKAYWFTKDYKREKFYYLEATLTMLYTPAVYTGIIWILLCWIIEGNPFYFLNSNYSNQAQSENAVGVSTVPQLVQYVAFRAMPFLILFFAILLYRLIQRKIARYDVLCLICLVMSLLGFHTLMFWRGSSFGWLRFFCYSLPICSAWIPYECYALSNANVVKGEHETYPQQLLRQAKKKNKNAFHLSVLLLVAFVISSFLLNQVMEGRAISDYEGSTHGKEYQIANYINEKIPEKRILTDVFTTYYVALNTDHFQNLIVSSSQNFKQCVADPIGNEVDYILVPDPKLAENDAINRQYPDIYNHGADWCTESKDFGDYKLFQVTG
ncbi:hypothetical protein A7X67_09475 [Clostridium sp. W14A]|nr:hypothetical protein A7X67_09475 [Clostridium sp. W14A]